MAFGDIVVGATWRKIQKLDVYAYFDRVESEANPVDGLSRGRMDGPWQRVVKAKLPQNLLQLLGSDARNKAGSGSIGCGA